MRSLPLLGLVAGLLSSAAVPALAASEAFQSRPLTAAVRARTAYAGPVKATRARTTARVVAPEEQTAQHGAVRRDMYSRIWFPASAQIHPVTPGVKLRQVVAPKDLVDHDYTNGPLRELSLEGYAGAAPIELDFYATVSGHDGLDKARFATQDTFRLELKHPDGTLEEFHVPSIAHGRSATGLSAEDHVTPIRLRFSPDPGTTVLRIQTTQNSYRGFVNGRVVLLHNGPPTETGIAAAHFRGL